MAYVNEITVVNISKNEILPFTVEVQDLEDIGTNTIVSATRYERNSLLGGVDISSQTSINNRVVTFADIWAGGETREAGFYRIRLVTQNASGTVKVEVNLYIYVFDS